MVAAVDDDFSVSFEEFLLSFHLKYGIFAPTSPSFTYKLFIEPNKPSSAWRVHMLSYTVPIEDQDLGLLAFDCD